MRVGVPVGSILETCICRRPPIFSQCPHQQFPAVKHEHQRRVWIHSAIQLRCVFVAVTEEYKSMFLRTPPNDQLRRLDSMLGGNTSGPRLAPSPLASLSRNPVVTDWPAPKYGAPS